MLICSTSSGISIFLPSIIQGIGYKSLSIQYMTIPIYIVSAIGIFFMAWLSDRYQRRGAIMLFFSIFTITGYGLLIGCKTPGVRYFACYLVILGGNVIPALNITWINGNTAPYYKRATALAMNQTIGNIGGVIAGQIYLTTQAPYYLTGQAVALTGCLLSWVGTGLMWFILHKKNQAKEKKIQEGVTDTGKGDESIYFKYQL
jgi:MFS family permease